MWWMRLGLEEASHQVVVAWLDGRNYPRRCDQWTESMRLCFMEWLKLRWIYNRIANNFVLIQNIIKLRLVLRLHRNCKTLGGIRYLRIPLLLVFPLLFFLLFLWVKVLDIKWLSLRQVHSLAKIILFFFIHGFIVFFYKFLRKICQFFFVLFCFFVFIFNVLISLPVYFLKLKSHLPLFLTMPLFVKFIQPISLINDRLVFSQLGISIILFILQLLGQHFPDIRLVFKLLIFLLLFFHLMKPVVILSNLVPVVFLAHSNLL